MTFQFDGICSMENLISHWVNRYRPDMTDPDQVMVDTDRMPRLITGITTDIRMDGRRKYFIYPNHSSRTVAPPGCTLHNVHAMNISSANDLGDWFENTRGGTAVGAGGNPVVLDRIRLLRFILHRDRQPGGYPRDTPPVIPGPGFPTPVYQKEDRKAGWDASKCLTLPYKTYRVQNINDSSSSEDPPSSEASLDTESEESSSEESNSDDN